MEICKILMAMPASPADLFYLWMGVHVKGKFLLSAWRSFFYAVIWNIWKARNEIVFEGGQWNQQHMALNIRQCVASWI